MSVSPELHAQILRYYYVERWRTGTIARQLQVHHGSVERIIDSRQFNDLATNPYFSTHDFRAVPQPYRTLVPEYIKDYVPLNQFAA